MKKSRIIGTVCTCLFFTNVEASTIFSDIPGLENLEWLELTATADMSRNHVESELVTGGMFEGWRYATRNEVELLYDALWGGTAEGWATDNYEGARMFFDAFGVSDWYSNDNNSGYTTDGYTYWWTFFGTNECDNSISPDVTCLAQVQIKDENFEATINSGWFADEWGLSFGLDSTNDQGWTPKTSVVPFAGSHLVRVNVIPIPAAVWLFGSGLLGLIGLARRMKNV